LRKISASFRIACIVPTFNGLRDFTRLFKSLSNQRVNFDLFVVDSGSTDGTLEYLIENRIEYSLIKNTQFNHGGTRQMMVDIHSNYDIYIFVTQDAYLDNGDSIYNLVKPFMDSSVGAVCGRQIPHLNANPFAKHARAFNYPNTFSKKNLADVPKLGLKTVFLSNSFAAYRKKALQAVGGFPVNVIFAEDMYVAAKMVKAGWDIAYAGDARCRHSHNYSILEEFRRYFDMGVFHSREFWIRSEFGGAGSEGIRYIISEIKFIGISRCYLLPSLLIRNSLKLLGYKMGLNEKYLPLALKKYIGSFRSYWTTRSEPH
jgi:rhamnosyltransferase